MEKEKEKFGKEKKKRKTEKKNNKNGKRFSKYSEEIIILEKETKREKKLNVKLFNV
jgi:transcriptional/translational regulatory protein YebC/TACO1